MTFLGFPGTLIANVRSFRFHTLVRLWCVSLTFEVHRVGCGELQAERKNANKSHSAMRLLLVSRLFHSACVSTHLNMMILSAEDNQRDEVVTKGRVRVE
jgi:hypothetical protein